MRIQRYAAVAAGVAIAFSLGACAGEKSGSSSDEKAASAPSEISGGGDGLTGAKVKLGLLTGLTGDYSAFSDAVVNGSKIAIEDINASGGILGGPASLVIQDNKSTSEGAVSGFQKLIDIDKVVAVGGVESDGGVAVLQRAAERKVPVICSFCGTPILDTKGGDYEWRFTASDTDGGVAVAQFARDRGYKRVSILAQSGEVGRPADVFKQVFEDKVGGEIVSDVRFDPGKASYQAETQKAFSGKPDAVYLAAGHEAAASILPEWQRRNYGGKLFVSPDLITPDTTFKFLEGGVATGTIAAFDEETPAYEHFAKRLEDVAGEPPSEGLGEPLNYDSFVALALAITAGKSTDGAPIKENLPKILNSPGKECFLYDECVKLLEGGEDIDYHGASTSLDVNENGNLLSPVMAEIQLKDGEWGPVKTVALDPSLKP
jgi:branched-chain amino acid transport system substrate-binding protein